jgi:Icc-related predicted phosphoesterase
MSDTHGYHRRISVPPGEVLIHAGDFTHTSHNDLIDFDEWLAELPHPFKILVAGNHDRCFEDRPTWARANLVSAIYLQDQAHVIGGVKFYGSPWQPAFCNWAFNLERGKPLREKWDLIPNDVDVLITHGPPAHMCDLNSRGKRVGCADLREADLRIQPKFHVFGHNHEGYGIEKDEHTTYINASICTAFYSPTNAPIVFEV